MATIDLPHLIITVSDHKNNPFGIQWQRYWGSAPYPELVNTVPHVAFKDEDMDTALKGQKVIIEPNRSAQPEATRPDGASFRTGTLLTNVY